ncbi:hypothetical protein ACQR16_36060, partial [Bradyrhizobium oligotrophicum]|uniref:hypothetical protein n=1 Tax=Bradyrhizobium oligotrophicum TaxID=44255 RepID=UPI003EC08CB2
MGVIRKVYRARMEAGLMVRDAAIHLYRRSRMRVHAAPHHEVQKPRRHCTPDHEHAESVFMERVESVAAGKTLILRGCESFSKISGLPGDDRCDSLSIV